MDESNIEGRPNMVDLADLKVGELMHNLRIRYGALSARGIVCVSVCVVVVVVVVVVVRVVWLHALQRPVGMRWKLFGAPTSHPPPPFW